MIKRQRVLSDHISHRWPVRSERESLYVSLSGVWGAWPPPYPLSSLDVPSLFTWGSSDHLNELDAILEGNYSSIWDEVPAPKHKVVFADGDHWDYLPRSLSTKQAVRLVRPLLLYGRCQAIIPFSADDASMPQTLGER